MEVNADKAGEYNNNKDKDNMGDIRESALDDGAVLMNSFHVDWGDLVYGSYFKFHGGDIMDGG